MQLVEAEENIIDEKDIRSLFANVSHYKTVLLHLLKTPHFYSQVLSMLMKSYKNSQYSIDFQCILCDFFCQRASKQKDYTGDVMEEIEYSIITMCTIGKCFEDIKDTTRGLTPLAWAVIFNNYELAQKIVHLSNVNLIVDMDKIPYYRKNFHISYPMETITLLTIAYAYKNYDMVDLLIKNGFKMNLLSENEIKEISKVQQDDLVNYFRSCIEDVDYKDVKRIKNIIDNIKNLKFQNKSCDAEILKKHRRQFWQLKLFGGKNE